MKFCLEIFGRWQKDLNSKRFATEILIRKKICYKTIFNRTEKMRTKVSKGDDPKIERLADKYICLWQDPTTKKIKGLRGSLVKHWSQRSPIAEKYKAASDPSVESGKMQPCGVSDTHWRSLVIYKSVFEGQMKSSRNPLWFFNVSDIKSTFANDIAQPQSSTLTFWGNWWELCGE